MPTTNDAPTNLLTHQWLDGERRLRLFERAWRSDMRPVIQDFLPSDPTIRYQVLFELVLLDMDFRDAAGEAVRIESYLQQLPELSSQPDAVVELVVAELQLKSNRDPVLAENEIQARFPELADQITARLIARHNASDSSRDLSRYVSTRRRSDSSTANSLRPDLMIEPVFSVPGYEPIKVLGQGAMGIVYEARQTSLGRNVALKVLRSNASDLVSHSRFRAEAEMIAALRHENIVALHGYGEHMGQPYLALELVRGQTLEQAWCETPPTPRQVAELVQVLSAAVHHAHSHGIVHRDLKPGNVLVRRSDRSGSMRTLGTVKDLQPKIADFGLATGSCITESATVTGEFLGTPAYTSPEQASGLSKQVGPPTDVHALGAILYRGLTGMPPYRGSNLIETLSLVRWHAAAPPRLVQPGVASDLNTICLKCLNKSAQLRYQSAQELADDLGRYLDGKPILARRTSLAKRCWMWCRRRPTISLMSIVMIAMAITGGSIVWNQWRAALRSLDEANQREAARRDGLVNSLISVTADSAAAVLMEVSEDLPEIRDPLLQLESTVDPSGKIRLDLALVNEPDRLKRLSTTILSAPPDEFVFLRNELQRRKPAIDPKAWKEHLSRTKLELENPHLNPQRRFHALLMFYEPSDTEFIEAHGAELIDRLLNANPLDVHRYYSALLPLASGIEQRLLEAVDDSTRSGSEKQLAATLLAETYSERPADLTDLLLRCDDDQFAFVIQKLFPHRLVVLPQLRQQLQNWRIPEVDDSDFQRRCLQHSNLALALFALEDEATFWPLMTQSQHPELRTYLIHRLSLVCPQPRKILDRMELESDAGVRTALLMSLGKYVDQLSDDETFVDFLAALYRNDPSCGVHGAVRWLLQQVGQNDLVQSIDEELAKRSTDPTSEWYVTPHGHTMRVVRGPVQFVMGMQTIKNATQQPTANAQSFLMTIDRTWAISTMEVTLPQFRRLFNAKLNHPVSSPDPAASVHAVQWYEAAKYCRWLSEQEGIEESEMCYPPRDKIGPGMQMPDNYLERSGYRLPTEAEWEVSCRAGSVTRYGFGDSDRYLDRYGRTVLVSRNRVARPGTLLPNDFGLFDCHGNLAEWCQETSTHHQGTFESREDVEQLIPVVNSAPYRVLRGSSYLGSPSTAQSAFRSEAPPMFSGYANGFRIVRTVK